MAHGRKSRKKVVERKMYAAKLLQQFSGTPRFGKRRFHLQASLTERPPKRKIFFSEFLLEVKCEKEKNYIENLQKIIFLCRIVSTSLDCRQEQLPSTVICST